MYSARAAPRLAMLSPPRAAIRLSNTGSMRFLHLRPTPVVASKKDDLMDRESMDPTSTEHSKSGGDQQTAQDDEAFNPQTTGPEEQRQQAEKKEGSENNNPLKMSGADPNQGADDAQRSGSGKSPEAAQGGRKMSGGGSPKKDGSAGGH